MKYIGVHRFAELIDGGMTRKEIRRQLADGELVLLRHDWYANKRADTTTCEVVRAGGVVGCLTALRYRKVWVPGSSTTIHRRGNSRAHRAPSKITYCRQYGRPEPEYGAVDEVPIAFRHAVRCLDGEELVAVCDSIANQKLMTIDEMRSEMRSAPKSKQRLLDKCDARAQSGTETMTRLRLRARRLKVRVQVKISGLGHVDLVVGDRLIIEVDSEEYHRTKEQYEEDRRRDRRAAELGYITLRFTYSAVTTGWEAAEEQVLTIVREGRHLWPRKRKPKAVASVQPTPGSPLVDG
ncbi:DUF559 domain-containing protein [Gordonia sp. OPL2]|uniref:DUF559 domain-containing protein n=1 Tax=Gordonia sp. OPL2 TaxID=2486274 RepID=UPI0016567957|nr:DUF559 domain-containing protein [Gordonia sp. OPL2]ROZ98803.1 DUF559 domain-containing protein [Gordonia sp. OPL2]